MRKLRGFALIMLLAGIGGFIGAELKAQVNGGASYSRAKTVGGSRPTCDQSQHGALWVSYASGSSPHLDPFQICVSTTSGSTVGWRTVTVGSNLAAP